MITDSSIDATRKSFEESFSSGDFYNRQTQDAVHLEKILQFIGIEKNMRILDIKTPTLIQFNYSTAAYLQAG